MDERLTLHLLVTSRERCIVVVQTSKELLVVVEPTAPHSKLVNFPVLVVVHSGTHYDGVVGSAAVMKKLVDAVVPVFLDPSALTALPPLSGPPAELAPSVMQKVQAPGDKRFCPVDSCNWSIHRGAGPLAPSSLQHHLERMHQVWGERLSDGMLVPLGLRLCPKVGCGKVIEAKFEVCGGCMHFFAEGLLDRRDTEARPEVGPHEVPQDLPLLDEIALRRVPLLSPIPKACGRHGRRRCARRHRRS